MKKICILFLVVTMMLAVGCSKNQTSDTVEAYAMVIDQLYAEDSGLNHDIKYIALDTSLMVNLTDEGKEKLLEQLENYGFEVLNMTFEELEKQGYIQELFFKEGILFRIEDEPIKNNTITMKASKWRSGTGAIGFEDLIIKYKNGQWEITSLGSSWIS
ncbi:MAG: hypothetical protein ACOYVK_09200 [Bacillota bacterium]